MRTEQSRLHCMTGCMITVTHTQTQRRLGCDSRNRLDALPSRLPIPTEQIGRFEIRDTFSGFHTSDIGPVLRDWPFFCAFFLAPRRTSSAAACTARGLTATALSAADNVPAPSHQFYRQRAASSETALQLIAASETALSAADNQTSSIDSVRPHGDHSSGRITAPSYARRITVSICPSPTGGAQARRDTGGDSLGTSQHPGGAPRHRRRSARRRPLRSARVGLRRRSAFRSWQRCASGASAAGYRAAAWRFFPPICHDQFYIQRAASGDK